MESHRTGFIPVLRYEGRYFNILLVHILRLYAASNTNSGYRASTLNPEIKQLLTYLHANIRAHHDVEELARMVHLSRTQLDHAFKKQIGVPLGSYIRTMCIERA